MRLVINLVLVAIVLGLIYLLVDSIKEPIEFKAEKEKRERRVIDKLMTVRTAQEAYRGITGYFAPNFDTLSEVLTNGRFAIIQVFGDPDDPTNKEAVRYDTIYKPAKDSMAILGIKLDSLRYVPYTNGGTFNIDADTLTYQQTLVSVVEVGIRKKDFMGAFANNRFKKYDASYDPEMILKFGNMNKPTTAGNWE